MEKKETPWMSDPDNPETGTERHVAQLLAKIDAWRAVRGWSEGYFGKTVAKDVSVLPRMRTTGGVSAKILKRIEDFLAENPADKKQTAEAGQ